MAVFDPVDDGASSGSEALFDLREPLVDASPARRDELDEKPEIVDTCMPFRELVALEALEAAQHLVQEATHFRKVTSGWSEPASKTFVDGVAHGRRKARLELRRCFRERLDLRPGSFECGVDVGWFPATGRRPIEPLPRSLNSVRIHGVETKRFAGCEPPRPMGVSELDYDLPPELIAQHPPHRRDASRLLVYDRPTGEVRHRTIRELPDELRGELVVVNDTRVVPARIRLEEPRGEVLLLEQVAAGEWEALARPTRRLRAGRRYGQVEFLEHLGEGRWRVRIAGDPEGEVPLPPYITERLEDPARYQTVYAREAGSAAAPTAGLHFTPELLAQLDVERVTLHVGLDTFRPVGVDDLAQHRIHGERYEVAAEAWKRIRESERVLAVGTTTVRVLESLSRGAPLQGRTELFITPGFEFRRVDALLTNFHLPRSTLLALVMAFAGVEETRRVYSIAIAERYRFYSFGDAMLVL